MSATPPSIPAPRSTLPLRWIFWGAVLVIGLAAGLAVLLVDRGSRSGVAGVPLADAPAATWAAGKLRAPDFHLADQNGAPVSLAAYRGRPVLIAFLDPLCRDFCPLEAKRLNAAVRSFPVGERPAVIAVSVNVYGNARAILVRDMKEWNVDVAQWHWGVGRERELASVWKRYHVAVLVAKKVAGAPPPEVAHTEAAYVVDARGYQRAVFLWPYRSEAVTRTLRSLTSSS